MCNRVPLRFFGSLQKCFLYSRVLRIEVVEKNVFGYMQSHFLPVLSARVLVVASIYQSNIKHAMFDCFRPGRMALNMKVQLVGVKPCRYPVLQYGIWRGCDLWVSVRIFPVVNAVNFAASKTSNYSRPAKLCSYLDVSFAL